MTHPVLADLGVVQPPAPNPILRLWTATKQLGKRVLRKAAKETRRLRRAG